MSDTQWLRYEVFEKERPDLPHRNAGSVHAPDDEMALENARDVFVRRPNCLSLWVAPSNQIFAKTAEELAADSAWRDTPLKQNETYLVFNKQGQRNAETFVSHVGEVDARSPQEALSKALEKFSRENVFVWWVCPSRAVTRSEDGDATSMFAPARDKEYRQPNFYRVVTLMHELKASQQEARHLDEDML
jgi:ring-1,2-phenylacetyl-CoA epoxidase subunit PaaB